MIASIDPPTIPKPKMTRPASHPSEVTRVFAIACDMDTDTLQRAYPRPSWNNAYTEIRKVLDRHGFSWQQGSVYFGGTQINAVTCVLAVMDLARSLPWFSISVRASACCESKK